MLKGFKEFLARGNIVDLSVAVVIGTAFTALVTKFTESIIQPLIEPDRRGRRVRITASCGSASAAVRRSTSTSCCRRPSTSSLSRRSSTSSSCVPYNRLRKKGEVEQAQDTELTLLTEIRDILAETNGSVAQHVTPAPAPDRAPTPRRRRAPTGPDQSQHETAPGSGRGLFCCSARAFVSSCSRARRRW